MRSTAPAVAALALVVCAAVLGLLGLLLPSVAALALAALILVAAGAVRRRDREPIGEVEESVRSTVRDRRDRDGEAAAIRELRRHRPRTGLLEAREWVRAL